MRYTWNAVAEVLMISRTTLWHRLREMNFPLSSYSNISDSELDAVVSLLVERFPQNGIVMMWGHLKSINILVSRQKVTESLTRVAPELTHFRRSNSISRRVYSVPSPNYMWHIDGLHCLIRWRIVIHGAIDGYSRRILYLHASDNNRAKTIVSLFLEAVKECGWPSRVRSDKGGENIDVARAMLIVRGTSRKSHITGSSVHNQRIERLWRDTFRCVGHLYYSLFFDMEDCDLLDANSDHDLFSLHYTYLPRINNQLKEFASAWNSHPLRTEGGLSPLQMWRSGLLSSSAECQEEIFTGLTVNENFCDIDQSYVRCFDHEGIVIPPFSSTVNEHLLHHLRENINPLQRSNNNGLNIYSSVKDCICRF